MSCFIFKGNLSSAFEPILNSVSLATVVTPAMLTLSKFVCPSISKSLSTVRFPFKISTAEPVIRNFSLP